MPDAWRVTVKCPDAEAAKGFKERFYKQLYEERGTTIVFEAPIDDEAAAEGMVAAAKEEGLAAEKERFVDPLEGAEPVDFW